MTFTERLPAPLSRRLASATSNIFTRQGREVDIAIGGIPFRLATTTELPYTIETIPIRKDQVDTETDPGEQSLAGWWRRAQRSWHDGAGTLYQEDATQAVDSTSFFESEGVDVFTRGQMTLLKKMLPNVLVLDVKRLRSYTDAGTQGVTAIDNSDGALYSISDITGGVTTLHDPATTLVDGVRVGNKFYSVASDGTLYEGDVSSPGTATSWPCGGAPSRLRWGKHRLWIIGGRDIWQPDLSLAGGSAQNPVFTNPNQGWVYTCQAEGLGAMYFGGHDGNTSSIQAITLQSDGGLPTLSGAAITATLPEGELVQEIEVLAGSIMGIGTNRGFRTAKLETDGSLTYGPLLFEPEGVTACASMTTHGRFFLVSFTTASGTAKAYKVDTGSELDQNVFPYASDADLGTAGSVTSMTFVGDQLVATHSDGGLWYQSDTEYVDSGFLETGRIRYRTTEPKMFRFLQIEIQPLEGTIAVELILEGGSTSSVATLNKQGRVGSEKYPITVEPMRYGSVRFTLLPTGDGTGTPILNSYQVSALPAVAPQRLITVPLLCYDKEKSRSGQWYGGEGFALDRLTALQTLESLAQTVTFQDFTLGDSGQIVTIERIRFVQTAPARSDATSGGAGGILLLELRTAEE